MRLMRKQDMPNYWNKKFAN